MKIAVVGAGIAGLHAARKLTDAGHEVHVFEAADRIGGRIQSIDHDGLIFESLAEWILPEHLRTLNLARSLGLVPIESPLGPNRLYFKGERASSDALWEDAQLDDLRLKNELDTLLDSLDNPKVTAFQVGRLDSLSLQVLLKTKSISEKGAWWLETKLRAELREDPGRMSVYGYLKDIQRDRKRPIATTGFHIPGGLSAVIAKLAAALKQPPIIGKRLAKVEWKNNQSVLTFADGHSDSFDQTLLAMPPKALLQIDFNPTISAKKRAAWEACNYGRAMKIVLEFSREWWTEAGWNGRLLTDRPIQRTWDGTVGRPAPPAPEPVPAEPEHPESALAPILPEVQPAASTPQPEPARPGVLVVWICGNAVEAWAKLADPARVALEDLALIFPQAKEFFVGGSHVALLGDSPSGGAYFVQTTGFVLAHTENLATPEGRVHFASDFTGEFAGRVEGSIESADRAATEILLS